MQRVESAAVARRPPVYHLEGRANPWQDWRKTLGLVKHLTKRDLAARYRGSSLGFLWSLLNPVFMMCIYTFVFQYILRVSSPGVPFPAFFLTGLTAWNFFAVATMNAATSLVSNRPLIEKTYFPRIALPLSAVLSSLFNYIVCIPVLIVFNAIFGLTPAASMLLLPLVLLHLFFLALGVGLLYASVAPFFRDIIQLLQIIHLAWFFATTVLYPVALAKANLSPAVFHVYQLNPLLGALAHVRFAFLSEQLAWSSVAISGAATLSLLLVGWLVFQRLAPEVTRVN
jgi:ABC-type polysaccharide/polyol phosphate export permease